MIKLLVWVAFFVATLNGASQDIYGTLIIATQCKDGILVCADTRSTWSKDTSRWFFAHHTQKIFPIADKLLAIEGLVNYRDTFVNAFFDTSTARNQSPLVLLTKTSAKVSMKLDSIMVSRNLGTRLLVAGYDSGEGIIVTTGTNWSNGMIHTSYAILGRWRDTEVLESLIGLSSHEAVEIINNVYFNEAKQNDRIGGSVVIWLIDNQTYTPRCIQHCFDNSEIRTTRDFYKAVFKKTISLTPIPPFTEELINQYVHKEARRLNINRQ